MRRWMECLRGLPPARGADAKAGRATARERGWRPVRSRSGLSILVALVGAAMLAVLTAAPALAIKVGSLPTPGTPVGSEARTDELVSPANMSSGGEAGYSEAAQKIEGGPDYAVAAANGESVMYTVGSAAGETNTAYEPYAVSRWSSSQRRWLTSALLPPPLQSGNFKNVKPVYLYPSADLSQAVFTAISSYVTGDPSASSNVYLSNGFTGQPEWIGRPSPSPFEPLPRLGEFDAITSLQVVGASPNLKTVYFAYPGTLLPGDPAGVTNLYEWHEGTLVNAAVLPEGTLPAAGAKPAAQTGFASSPNEYDNEVSADGSHLFFSATPPGSTQPQIYARIHGAPAILVTRDDCIAKEGACTATPATVGQPAPDQVRQTSFYASPDGNEVFFQDEARLTEAAPENSQPKMYEFDVATEQLRYVEDIATGVYKGGTKILATSANGDRALYIEGVSKPFMLKIWERHADGSEESRPIAEFKKIAAPRVASARATDNGEVFVFDENHPMNVISPEVAAGGPPGGEFASDTAQVYRYSVAGEELTCVSCLPEGKAATGNAYISTDDEEFRNGGRPPAKTNGRVVDNRGMTANGEEIFFYTPESLVPQDVNGAYDVYEWKAGHVELISSGHSSEPSILLDNGEAGNNVFFATTSALAAQDTEGTYSVYDARIGAPPPLPGSAKGCDSHCQQTTAPPVPTLLLSGAIGPSGNLTPPAPTSKRAAKGHKKGKTGGNSKASRRRKRLLHALKRCRHRFRHNRHGRRACKHRARKRLGKVARSSRGRGGRRDRGHQRQHKRSRSGGRRRGR